MIVAFREAASPYSSASRRDPALRRGFAGCRGSGMGPKDVAKKDLNYYGSGICKKQLAIAGKGIPKKHQI